MACTNPSCKYDGTHFGQQCEYCGAYWGECWYPFERIIMLPLLLLILFIFLFACAIGINYVSAEIEEYNLNNTAVALAHFHQTQTATNMPPTATPTASNTSEPTYTSTASHTPEPTNTLLPTPTSSNTPSPTATFTFTPTSSATPPPTISNRNNITISGRVNTGRLNVRSGPGSDHYIVYRVSNNDSVQIIGRNRENTWVVIDAGIVGWVNVEYLVYSGRLSDLTVYNSRSSLPSSTRTVRFSCPGARGPSFRLGDRFIVPRGNGGTTIWSEPNSAPRVTRVTEGNGGVIIAGPICVTAAEGHLVVWYVRSDNGFEGYISEGYRNSPVAWIAPDN